MTPKPVDSRKRFLVTSALPYANGPLHFGHLAGVYIPADIYTRHRRLQGHKVLHICGSDEHGVAIMISAEREGADYQSYVDHWHKEHKRLFEAYDILFDFFGRTSSLYHKHEVIRWFNELKRKGYLEEKTSKQLYSLDEERFLPDRYVEGTCYVCGYPHARGDECPNCGEWIDAVSLINPRSKITGSDRLEVRESMQFFLLLTRLQELFLPWFERKTEWRKLVKGFVRGLLKKGMVDRAITRDLKWGIDVPGEENQGKKIYVWFDAPIGYVSFVNEFLKRESLGSDSIDNWWNSKEVQISHFIGKDNIIFHAYIWPCMILGTGFVNPPTEIPANEFVNLGGRQFSKSDGTSIDCHESLMVFGVDALRFYLCSIIPEKGDTNFSWDGFSSCQLEFGNKIGNFIHRTLTFVRAHWPLGISAAAFTAAQSEAEFLRIAEFGNMYRDSLNLYNFSLAQGQLLAFASGANEFFHNKKPWSEVKSDRTAAERTIAMAVIYVVAIAVFIEPIAPGLSKNIANYFGPAISPLLMANIYRGDLSYITTLFQSGFRLNDEPRVLIPRVPAETIATWKTNLK